MPGSPHLSPISGSLGQEEEALELPESCPLNTRFALGLPLWQGPAWTLLEGWPSSCCYMGQDQTAELPLMNQGPKWLRLCWLPSASLKHRPSSLSPLQFLPSLIPPTDSTHKPSADDHKVLTPSPYSEPLKHLFLHRRPHLWENFLKSLLLRGCCFLCSVHEEMPRNASLTAGWHLLRNVWTVPAYAPWGLLSLSGHFSSCSEGWGCLSPTGSWAASRFMSRAVECGGRDPGLRPPRLESFVLRSLYGCVRLHRGLESVFVPCLGSQWEGNRPRGYITLQPSAFQNTTQSGEAQLSTFRVSGTGPEMWLRFQQLWHFPV